MPDLGVNRPPSAARAVLKSWTGRIGIGVGLLVIGIIVIGPVIAPYDPNEIGVGVPLAGATTEHLLGTDDLGRDVWSRFLNGGRSVVLIPLGAVVLAFLAGGLPGMFAAYAGGKADRAIARGFDLLLTMPPLVIVLVAVSALGTSSWVLMIMVGVVFAPRVGRIARGSTQAVVTSDYVLAAQARGERTLGILAREIAPNIAGPTVADLALRLTYAIIFISTINFLGLGAQPPSSDWGLAVATNRAFVTVQPLATVVPAFAIICLSVAFNLVADALTRAFVRAEGGESAL